jgi:hypothetical protein
VKRLDRRLNDVLEGAMLDGPLLLLTFIDRERIRAMLAKQSTDLENVQQ